MSSVFDRDQVRAWGPWLIWVILFALVSAVVPRDASFDVAHYHLHNGWSALNGRLKQDLAPAEMHSFLNPTYNLVVWWLIERLPGPAVAAILGALQALIVPVLYFLGRSLFRLSNVENAERAALVCAFVGFVCVPVLATMASLRNDTLGALAFCAALMLLLRDEGKSASLKRFAMAAFIVGLAAGMKLTNVVYVPGLAVFVLVARPGFGPRIRGVLVSAAGGLIGMALMGGWWMALLYEAFANPVFPLLNTVFDAPLGSDSVSRDVRYLPSNFLEAVAWPALAAFDLSLINEDDGRDLRLAAFYVGALALPALALVSARHRAHVPRAVLAVSLACVAFVLFWVLQFSIMRYAMAAFLLGPMLLVLAWQISPLRKYVAPAGKPALYGMALIFIFTMKSESVRRIPWSSAGEGYLSVERPEQFSYEGAGVIMAGPFPVAFTATAFSDAAWITHGDVQPWSRPFLENYRPEIRSRISSSSVDLFAVICVQDETGETAEKLANGLTDINTAGQTLARLAGEYPVTGNAENCAPLETSFDTDSTHWVVCPLTRTVPAQAN
ncbi:hypothetical protein [Henriciella marina]|uniref:hypothetical protein n=1 Tax=Henriciella marina TaxID=453851 RepID=UPI000367FA56|nr:hypothetical protein [Henriciella marina]